MGPVSRLGRLLVVLVPVLIGASCSRPAEPEFVRLENTKVRGAKRGGNLLVSADARFLNPNRLGIDVTRLDVELFVDDRQAATIRQHVEVSVPGRSEFVLPLEIEVPIQKVYEDVGDLLNKLFAEKKVMVRLEGKITVHVLKVEFRTPFVYEREYTLE